MKIACGHSRRACAAGEAEPTPNLRASYEAVVTTARGPVPGDDDRLADQLRPAQQLDRDVEGVAVEVGDHTAGGHDPP